MLIPFRKKNSILIGGWSIGHGNNEAIRKLPSVVYDYDVMVWCVRRARLISKLQNVSDIFTDYRLFSFLVFFFFCYVILAYAFAQMEDMDWDGIRVLLSCFSIALNMPTKYVHYINIGYRRLLYSICGLLPVMIMHMTVVSFYTSLINSIYHEPQVNTWIEIRNNNFTLAVDEETAKNFKKFITVNNRNISCLSLVLKLIPYHIEITRLSYQLTQHMKLG